MDLDLPRVLAGLAFLAVAAAMDLRAREVKDEVWIAMGGVAIALVVLDLLLDSFPPVLLLLPLATAILFFGVFFGEEMWSESGFRVRPARFAAYALVPAMVVVTWYAVSSSPDDAGAFYRLLTMPAMVVVAHGMYQFNLLRGGADAKAVMAIALLVPGVYPHVAGFPLFPPSPVAEPILAVLIPFAFVVLINGALLFLTAPVYFIARNAAGRSLSFPHALFGYRAPIDEIPTFVWLMDRVEDGRRRTTLFPRAQDDRDEQLGLLRQEGVTEVWVTPQLPFLAGLFLGFVLAVVAGNLLLVLLAMV